MPPRRRSRTADEGKREHADVPQDLRHPRRPRWAARETLELTDGVLVETFELRPPGGEDDLQPEPDEEGRCRETSSSAPMPSFGDRAC